MLPRQNCDLDVSEGPGGGHVAQRGGREQEVAPHGPAVRLGHQDLATSRDDAIGTAKLRLHKVLVQPEACFGGWLPLSAKLGGEPDSSLGEIRVEVRLLYGEEAGHVKEHHLGREMSKVERWWYGDEGVEKYYDIGEKLGAGAFAEVRTPPHPPPPCATTRVGRSCGLNGHVKHA